MAERHGEDYEAFLRELVQTTLVVRVEEEGDYTLEYTDKSGNIQRQSLAGMKPGEPRSVSGADSLAPAKLTRGDETVVVRAGVNGIWWAVGDIPLGFNMTEGAKGVYDFTSRVEETISLQDLDLEEQGFIIDKANFQLTLPIDGEVSYDLGTASGSDGAPLTLAGSIEIPPSAGDLAVLEIEATMEGEDGTAGLIAGVDEARASASARMWWQDGQPVAAQFLGGDYSADPRATMWADGFFAEMAQGQNCAGTSKADRCEPEDLEAVSGSEEADEKEVFDADDFPRINDPNMSAEEREEAQKALDLLRQFFALDIVRGDKLSIVVQASEEDIAKEAGPEAPRMSFRMDFTLEAVADEQVTVPAGTFDTLKITEEIRTQMRIQEFANPDNGQPLINAFNMDEIVGRSTFWLEEDTWRPVKMEASTPIDIDALLKRMINSVSDDAWNQIGGKPIDDNDWRITMTGESKYEAKELRGATHYSPLVGLTLAHLISSSSSAPMMWAISSAGMGMGPMFGPDYGSDYGSDYGYAEPTYGGGYDGMYPTPQPTWHMDPAPREPMSLSLVSNGPIEGNVKGYTVASAHASWSSLGIMIDGVEHYQLWADDGTCPTPMEEQYAICRGGATLEGYEQVEEGDELFVYASPGSNLRIIDYESNSVVLTMTVA